jgi:hypothetical protein
MSEKQEKGEGTAFETRTRELLEESTARLDGRTLSRLTQARHAALGQLQRPVRQSWRVWIPAGAAAAVAIVAVTFWSGPGPEPVPETVTAGNTTDDLEIILADGETPDFVDDGEDLEFYEWAATELETAELES